MSLKWEPKKPLPPVRYILFSSTEWQGLGGWSDCHGRFDDLERARDAMVGTVSEFKWAHIVDWETGQVICDWQDGRWKDRAQ